MKATQTIGMLAVGLLGLGVGLPSYAHGGAGEREFPATLTTDDPAVKDEASVPTVAYVPNKGSSDEPGSHETDVSFEFDKTLTDKLGIGINTGYTRIHQPGSPLAQGTQNVSTTLKYQYLVKDAHEFISSVGITREWGGTGTRAVADHYGSTTPTFYFGKGLGDLPIGMLRPLAVTGTLGVQYPDRGSDDPRMLNTGLAIEYSIPYLQDQVKDFGLPGWVGRLTPLVELSYSRPIANANGQGTTGVIAPGVIYANEKWQLGIEALLPATRATQIKTGVLVQFHVFFSDLIPGLAKPVF